MTVSTERRSNEETLADQARIPDHVVYKTFVRETVVLNLRTGQYHGLNPTAGRIFELLDAEPTLHHVAREIAGEYARPVEEVEEDICDLVWSLLERNLIELSLHRQS